MKKDNSKGVKFEARQLPSGSWRCQPSFTDEDGIQHRASFTKESKELAEAMALAWKAGIIDKVKTKKSATVGEALDAYIETGRCTGMKADTIKAHVSSRNNAFKSIEKRRVQTLALRDIQKWINERSQAVAPKTVKNNLDLLKVALKQYDASLDWNALRLPRGRKTETAIPSDDQVAAMLAELRTRGDDQMYIAVMLASLYGLRRSEICALEWSDISPSSDGRHVLEISKALVYDENNLLVLQDTKTEAGARIITLSDHVYVELMKRRNLRTNIISISPNSLSNRYALLAKKHGVNTRFHALRHYMASVMMRDGVEAFYAAKILGHASPATTQNIYTHVMGEKVIQINDRVDAHAVSILSRANY